jgi:threonine/homoserine/homoserine lactone efflux protein
MYSVKLNWRDRLLLINSVLFCVVGGALLLRTLLGQAPLFVGLLGAGLLVFGGYRLLLARREMRRRAAGNGHG